MKSLKFKVISSLLTAALLIPAAAVHAEGTTGTNSFGSGFVKQQQRLLTVKERQEFKAAMVGKKDTIKKSHEINQGIRKTIEEKRTTVKAMYKDIRENHKVLSSENLSKVEALLKEIQTDKSSLLDTKGTIKSAFEAFKTDVKNKDYDAAASELDKVISIQNTRTTVLNKLSSDLDSVINILQTAASITPAAPEDSTASSQAQ